MNSFWFPAKSTNCVRIISKKLSEIADDIGEIAEDSQEVLVGGLELVQDMATLQLDEIKDDQEDVAEDFDELAESVSELQDDIVDLVTLNDKKEEEEETKSSTHDPVILLAESFESTTAYRTWERDARVAQLKELCVKINVDDSGPGKEIRKRLRAIATQLPL